MLTYEEGIAGMEKTAHEELHILYFLPNIIRMIKSGKMRWGDM
jgi:hypothetical protein